MRRSGKMRKKIETNDTHSHHHHQSTRREDSFVSRRKASTWFDSSNENVYSTIFFLFSSFFVCDGSIHCSLVVCRVDFVSLFLCTTKRTFFAFLSSICRFRFRFHFFVGFSFFCHRFRRCGREKRIERDDDDKWNNDFVETKLN